HEHEPLEYGFRARHARRPGMTPEFMAARRKRTAAPSPRWRGEGWGEGLTTMAPPGLALAPTKADPEKPGAFDAARGRLSPPRAQRGQAAADQRHDAENDVDRGLLREPAGEGFGGLVDQRLRSGKTEIE